MALLKPLSALIRPHTNSASLLGVATLRVIVEQTAMPSID
jgi:hypothetical protein